MIRNWINNMNMTIKTMLIGILSFGVFFQAVFVWLASDKLSFTTGLWIGVGISVFMALHMNMSVENAVERDGEAASGYMRRMYVIRTVLVIALFFAVYFLKLGNVAAVFLGLFSLKLGTYLSVPLKKYIEKRKEKM